MRFKQTLKNILPKEAFGLYHYLYAWYGAWKYRHPSQELLVIGITGTSGKSSTIHFLRHLLGHAGYRVGSLSTVDFSIAGNHMLNDQKMTMLGKTAIQAYLRRMVDAGCEVAIIETTSEGAVQHRHRFIAWDVMMLTNLYPEHIESHGSFERYKAAKLSLFSYAAGRRRRKKTRWGAAPQKRGVVNGNIEYACEFLSFPFDKKIVFGREDRPLFVTPEAYTEAALARDIFLDKEGLHFTLDGHSFLAPLYAEYAAVNITAAAALARSLDIPWSTITTAVSSFTGVPGRIEFIPEAEALGFQVIVDYAFEPVAMGELYKVAALRRPQRIIHVLGSTGGGRDVSRRFTVGEFVGTRADICIVTDEDPYDDDPAKIMQDVADAIKKTGKKEGADLYQILDRREAVAKAVALARPGDLVLVTGKGSEQAMCVAGGKKIPWDDRRVVREALAGRLGG